MLWKISFWILVLMILVPLPFKIAGYLSGKDKSPLPVKIEEITNAIFFAVGLVAFYGYISRDSPKTPSLWYCWLAIAVAWSISSIFWSAKLRYAEEVLGKRKMRIATGISLLLYAPLLAAVYLYASQA